MTKPTQKYMLVKAEDGKGFYLNQQKPNIYVSGRPHVVKNDPQAQLGSARGALIILGETKMNDEEFAEAYVKDPAKAIKDAVVANDDADHVAVREAGKSSAASEKARKAAKKEEAERLKSEAEAKKAAQKAAAEAKKAKSKANLDAALGEEE